MTTTKTKTTFAALISGEPGDGRRPMRCGLCRHVECGLDCSCACRGTRSRYLSDTLSAEEAEVLTRAVEAEARLAAIARTRRPTAAETREARAAYAAAAKVQRSFVCTCCGKSSPMRWGCAACSAAFRADLAREQAAADAAANAPAPKGAPSITGKLSQGQETPRFRATLRVGKTPVAELISDGRGGQARITWAPIARPGSACRADAQTWLAHEAARIWLAEQGDEPPAMLADPHEAALIVVPAALSGGLVAL